MKRKFLILLCLILFFVSVAAVSAAEDMNQTIDDDDALSVSEDIDEISAKDNGTFTALQKKIDNAPERSTIYLENDYTYDAEFSTDGITINKTLTIEGNGYVIDALSQSRIFHVTSSSVTLNNITFKNGYAENNGGAIYFENEIISNSRVSGVFIDNFAEFNGGAIYFENEISNSSVSGVFMDNSAGDYGGAIYFNRFSEEHSAEFYDDFVVVDGETYFYSEFILIDSGIYLHEDFIIMYGDVLFYNVSDEDSDSHSVEFYDYSVFVDGEIYFYDEFRLIDGEIYVHEDFIIIGDEVFFYTRVPNSLVPIASGEFISNRACYGGAIYCHFGLFSDFRISGEFNSNTAEEGGAIWTSGGSIKNCDFAYNKANIGGAVYGQYCDVANCNFTNNKVTGSNQCGGAVFFGGQGTVTNCDFAYNKASYGGAIYLTDDFDVINCDFAYNNASSQGGAIYVSPHGAEDSSVSGKFIGNTARTGGAIYFDGLYYSSRVSDSSISGEFIDNVASGWGGAIYFGCPVYDSSISGEFIGNSAASGSAMYFDDGLSNSSIIYSIIMNTIGIRGDKNFSFVNCWFGNNASNYDSDFYSKSESWLFLNASSTPITDVDGQSTVEFTLDNLYNSSSNTISHPDVSDLPDVVFELSALNGYLDKYSARPGESITFTSTGNKKGIVKATFGKVSYCIEINNLKLDVPDVTKDYGGPERLEITLTESGSPVANAQVNININGQTYNRTTDDDGKASLALNLNAGTYNATVTYQDISAVANVTINQLATTTAISYNKNSYNSVTLTALVDPSTATGDVVFTVNGKDYIEKISGSKATYTLNNLANDNYTAVAVYKGDINHKNSTSDSITFAVEDTINILAPDVIKYYGGSERFVVTLTDSGMPIVGASVNINVGGTDYARFTDSNGQAFLELNQDCGNYAVTTTYMNISKVSNLVINPASTKTSLSGVKDINCGDLLTVTASVNASSGSVTFNVGSKTQKVDVAGGKASYTVSDLSEGSYDVTATYADAKGNYLGSSDFKSFKVSKLNPALDVLADDIFEGQDAVFEIALNGDAMGNVTVNIADKDDVGILSGGKAIVRISGLSAGNYPFTVSYSGDVKYNSKSSTGNLSVVSVNVNLVVNDLVKYYGASDKLVAALMDRSNNPLSGEKIVFTINEKDYTRTTDSSGVASININLNAGNYTIGVRFDGNGTYDAIKTKAFVEIKSTVSGNDITKIYRNATQYYAKFVDTNGNVLKNTPVKFNINGIFYTRTTNDQGVAKMNINLNPGEYIITATNPNSTEMYSNTVNVLPNIVDNHDLTKYYRNDSQYVIKLLDDKGNPVGAGVTMQFNINGVFYTRTSNATGHVKMNINLAPGEYIITAEYNGYKTSNVIKVLPILEARDLNMKYRDGSKFEVKLVDGEGKAFAGQKITFNINGVFYDRTTDASGIARLTINLMAGEYIITSMYENGAAISNKVTIRS